MLHVCNPFTLYTSKEVTTYRYLIEFLVVFNQGNQRYKFVMRSACYLANLYKIYICLIIW